MIKHCNDNVYKIIIMMKNGNNNIMNMKINIPDTEGLEEVLTGMEALNRQ